MQSQNRRGNGGGWLRWIIVGLLAIFVVGVLATWAVAIATRHLPTGYPGWFYPFGFFPFGFLLFFLFLFLVVRVAFWGRWGFWNYHPYYWGDAREILRERYARGEISREQFNQMMRDLDQAGSGPGGRT
jgi:putative membrane protein